MKYRIAIVLFTLGLLAGCTGPKEDGRLPVGLQLYSVRDELRRDFRGTLGRVRDMGYEGVEFFDEFAGNTPEQVRAICDSLGLTIFSNHFPYQRAVQDFDGVVRDSRILGLQYITIPSMPARPGADPARFEACVTALGECAQKARAAGFPLLYHNHDFEFGLLPDGTPGYGRIFPEDVSDGVQAELDVCWADYAGFDVPELLHKYAGRVPVLHIKDYSRAAEGAGGRRVDFRPLGAGGMDLPAILAAAREAGVAWLCVEQDNPAIGESDCFAGPAESIRYLRAQGAVR